MSIFQIAYNLISNSEKLQDWGTLFIASSGNELVGVTARHVFARAKFAGEIEVGLRRPGEYFHQGWQGTVRIALHPVADLAIVRFPSGTALQDQQLNLSFAPPSCGEQVSVYGASNSTLLQHLAGPAIKKVGNVLASVPNFTVGRHEEPLFEVDLPGIPGCSGAPVMSSSNMVVGIYSRSGNSNGTLCTGIAAIQDLI